MWVFAFEEIFYEKDFSETLDNFDQMRLLAVKLI